MVKKFKAQVKIAYEIQEIKASFRIKTYPKNLNKILLRNQFEASARICSKDILCWQIEINNRRRYFGISNALMQVKVT